MSRPLEHILKLPGLLQKMYGREAAIKGVTSNILVYTDNRHRKICRVSIGNSQGKCSFVRSD